MASLTASNNTAIMLFSRVFSNPNLTYSIVTLRRLSSKTSLNVLPSEEKHDDSKMLAWQIHSYGGLDELCLSKSARKPHIMTPNDVLVQVSSSSVNPIDLAMMGGYGSVMLNAMRQVNTCSLAPTLEFPLTLGRDFCGRVVAKGLGVKKLRIGDEVWGTTPPHHQGSHAHNVLVNEILVQRKPVALNDVEAGSMLYAAVTAWSALKLSGGMYLSTRGQRVLVLGGSGGVGLMAVQMLKAWGSQVVTTCRTDAVPMLESLGVDCVVDYTQPEAERSLRTEGKYDMILDCAGLGSDAAPDFADCLKDWNFSKFVTLKSPMLRNVDSYGLVGGMMKNAVDLVVPNVRTMQASRSSTVRWGFFAPLPEAVSDISTLVDEGKMCPVVEKVYHFDELPSAYERVQQGHLRGKIVIAMERYANEMEYSSGQ